nr:hypothetical protein [Tanacetum cinerariifolium]
VETELVLSAEIEGARQHERQDRISNRLQLFADVVVVVDGRGAHFQWLGAGDGDHVADPAAILVLQRSTLLTVVGISQARRAHVRRDIALVIVERPAQALAVNELAVELAGQGPAHVIADVFLKRLALEDPQVQLLLESAGQRRPIGAHHFKALVDHFVLAIGPGDQARIALLAALLGTADGRHEKALEVGFELQLKGALQAVFCLDMGAPPVIDLPDERAADLRRLGLFMGLFQPDKRGVGVAGLGQRRIAFALRHLAPLGDPFDDGRQTVPGSRKARSPKTLHRVTVVWVFEALDQAHRIDQKRADDRRVLECRHRAAVAIHRQTGDRGALQQEGQQLGLVEDLRHQLAVLEVVARQCRLVLGEHAVNLIHALIRIVDGLAFTQQRLRDVFQAERGETPGGRPQRL